MTTDRALELAEAVLHQERRRPRILHATNEVDDVLKVLSALRGNSILCTGNDLIMGLKK